MQRAGIRRTAIFFVALSGMLCVSAEDHLLNAPSPAFQEFTRRVQDYVKIQSAVPRLRSTKQRKEIVERRLALVTKIQEVRSNARQGDMFTPDVVEEVRQLIKVTFQGPGATNVRKTIRQGSPVPGWKLRVNGDYPERLPLTTVPPTLLLQLPQLPTGVAYQIIGHDFVLEDTEARLILDFIPGVLP